MSMVNYTEEQVTTYLEHAQEVGLSRAMRDLGYPSSPHTAYKWADQRGIDITKQAQQRAAVMSRYLMEDMEEIQVAQAGIERVAEELMTNTSITADEHYKLSQALNKHVTTKQLLLGRVTNRSEQIHKDSVQHEVEQLMRDFDNAGGDNAGSGRDDVSHNDAPVASPANSSKQPVDNITD